jgi:hypothetical protein
MFVFHIFRVWQPQLPYCLDRSNRAVILIRWFCSTPYFWICHHSLCCHKRQLGLLLTQNHCWTGCGVSLNRSCLLPHQPSPMMSFAPPSKTVASFCAFPFACRRMEMITAYEDLGSYFCSLSKQQPAFRASFPLDDNIQLASEVSEVQFFHDGWPSGNSRRHFYGSSFFCIFPLPWPYHKFVIRMSENKVC